MADGSKPSKSSQKRRRGLGLAVAPSFVCFIVLLTVMLNHMGKNMYLTGTLKKIYMQLEG